jgi:hypothetical protein
MCIRLIYTAVLKRLLSSYLCIPVPKAVLFVNTYGVLHTVESGLMKPLQAVASVWLTHDACFGRISLTPILDQDHWICSTSTSIILYFNLRSVSFIDCLTSYYSSTFEKLSTMLSNFKLIALIGTLSSLAGVQAAPQIRYSYELVGNTGCSLGIPQSFSQTCTVLPSLPLLNKAPTAFEGLNLGACTCTCQKSECSISAMFLFSVSGLIGMKWPRLRRQTAQTSRPCMLEVFAS